MEKITKTVKFFAFVAIFSALTMPSSLQAKQSKLLSGQRIVSLCEKNYNSEVKSKDCACLAKKYKEKEIEIYKRLGTGTVPPHDAVFAQIDHECHLNTPDASKELGRCLQKPPVENLTTDQIEVFCKCQSKSLTEFDVMLQQMPYNSPEMESELRKEVLIGAKQSCKAQATREYY